MMVIDVCIHYLRSIDAQRSIEEVFEDVKRECFCQAQTSGQGGINEIIVFMTVVS
jgi:hypothetical protein